jgi:membrane protein required for colicin V production
MNAELIGGVGWLDWALLAVLLLSVIVGLWRGLVFEILSLAGWVAAFIAAQWCTPSVAPWLPFGVPGSALNFALAFAITFVVALLLWAIASKLIRLLVHATPLQPIDRLLGAVFGLVRGLVLLLVVTTLVLLSPARSSAAWKQSQGAAWLTALFHGLKPMLPASLAERLPA